MIDNETGQGPGICKCGCGRATNIAQRNRKSLGWIKGKPLEYLRGHNKLHERGPQTPDGMKWCGCCKTVKPIADFAVNKTQSDGMQGFCRACGRDKQAEWRKANRNKSTRIATDCHRRKKFGIEPHEYDAMLESQDGVCAICKGTCGTTPSGNQRALALDHDHATGAIRGILCAHCNRALGLLKDSPDLLAAAHAYLVHHKKRDSKNTK